MLTHDQNRFRCKAAFQHFTRALLHAGNDEPAVWLVGTDEGPTARAVLHATLAASGATLLNPVPSEGVGRAHYLVKSRPSALRGLHELPSATLVRFACWLPAKTHQCAAFVCSLSPQRHSPPATLGLQFVRSGHLAWQIVATQLNTSLHVQNKSCSVCEEILRTPVRRVVAYAYGYATLRYAMAVP